ncbi:MAG TPA: NAD(P)/FAD-dependent oxidoreductase [Actinomycetes bacterium]|nr:NAD(P)/FAD-dependent oxidoreductase [Actinomycetes bacterium]
MSGMDEREYDVVVVGAGPVGENVVDRVRAAGLSVAVVEERLVGGECSYFACVPSKALLRPVLAAAATGRVRGLTPARVDPPGVFARRDWWTGGGDDSAQVDWLASTGAELIRGHARLDGPRRVVVETDAAADEAGPAGPAGARVALVARHAVVLATGSSPALPPIDGLAAARPWTNRQATNASTVPRRLAVLGGGVVGAEMATAYAGLGAKVTVLARGPRLLGRMEPFAGELVADGLREAGVDVRLRTTVTAVHRQADGTVTVSTDGGETVRADQVLAALGRRPNTATLGVDTVGLKPGESVEVDDSLRATGVEDGWLYATGDVNGRNLLTHMGKYQARAAADVIVARATGKPDDAAGMRAGSDAGAVTQVIFTDPEVAAVGPTLEQAREQAGADGRVRAVDVEMSAASGAGLQADGYRGKARLVLDEDRRVVLGATFVGQDVAELLHAATIAVVGQVPLDALWQAVPAFPTMSEVWLRLLESAGL